MQEKTVTFNGAARIAGIITLPDGGAPDPEAAGVLILNEGILHRIGAGRLHVKLARHLASQGFICCRLDHSSIGDSGPRRGTESFEDAAPAEVQLAMDYLGEVYGLKKFIIYGLCSGSDVAFELGVADDRIAGLLHVDAHIYSTPKSRFNMYINHYGPRLFKLSAWRGAIKRKLKELSSGKKESKLDVLDDEGRDEWFADPDYIRVKPPKEYTAKGLRKIVEKKIPMYICFTDAGYFGEYNYVNQYRDAFSDIDFGDLLQLQHLKSSTHLVTALNHQRQLLEDIDGFLQKHSLLPRLETQEAA